MGIDRTESIAPDSSHHWNSSRSQLTSSELTLMNFPIRLIQSSSRTIVGRISDGSRGEKLASLWFSIFRHSLTQSIFSNRVLLDNLVSNSPRV